MKYSQYVEVAKVGDIIMLGGMGIVDGLRHMYKESCYNVMDVSDRKNIYIRKHNKKNWVMVAPSYMEQDCILFSKSEYKKLPNTIFGC